MFIPDTYNHRIRMINTSGIISTIAGNGTQGFSGDCGQATNAELYLPEGVTIYAGNIYIADYDNNRIREVSTQTCTTMGIAQEQVKENNSNLLAYPNPSTGSINIISISNIDAIKVTDMLGQVVYEAKPQTTTTILQLDNVGVYFITIINGAETRTKKVIVSR